MVFDCCGKKEKSRKIREKLDELLKDTQGELLIILPNSQIIFLH